MGRTRRQAKPPLRADGSDGSDCALCNEPNSICDMVQCDKCTSWLHYSCAGVTEEVKDQDWVCETCLKSIPPPSTSVSESLSQLNQAVDAAMNGASNVPVSEIKELTARLNTLLSNDRQLNEVNGSNVQRLGPNAVTSTAPNVTYYAPIRPEAKTQIFRQHAISGTPTAGTGGASVSFDNSASFSENYERKLRRLGVLRRMQELAVEEKNLLESLDVDDELIASTQGVLSHQQNSIQPLRTPYNASPLTYLPDTSIPVNNNAYSAIVTTAYPTVTATTYPIVASTLTSTVPHSIYMNSPFVGASGTYGIYSTPQPSHRVSIPGHVPMSHIGLNTMPFQSSFDTMNMQSFLARQSMKTDLPTFSGRADEWPIFISAYESSTNACQFSEVENLQRLQRSLKGTARTMVEALLANPTFVPQIINTLRNLFGRPETLIEFHLERIRREPGPNPKDLQSYVRFSVFVQNLCAAIQSSGLPQHMDNPSVLQDLVRKLPNDLFMQWGHVKRMLPVVNIKSFAIWLEGIANDICSVLPNAVRFDQEEKKPREKSSFNHHSDDDYQTSTVCDLCHRSKKTCKNLTKCTEFPKLTVEERWKTVKVMRVCFICLKDHTGTCNKEKECGERGCRRKHNPLLHNPKYDKDKSNSKATDSTQSSPKQSKSKSDSSTDDDSESNNYQASSSRTIFRIVPVTLKGPNKTVETFAFYDDGSALTLMNQALADELEIKGTSAPLHLKWTGGTHRTEEGSHRMSLEVSGNTAEGSGYMVDVRTVSDLDLTPQSLNVKALKKKYRHLKNVPIKSYMDVKAGLLIGSDHPNLSFARDYSEGRYGEPVATKTSLGWCIYGKPNSSDQPTGPHYHICDCQQTEHGCKEDTTRSYYETDSKRTEQKASHSLTNGNNSCLSNTHTSGRILKESVCKILNDNEEKRSPVELRQEDVKILKFATTRNGSEIIESNDLTALKEANRQTKPVTGVNPTKIESTPLRNTQKHLLKLMAAVIMLIGVWELAAAIVSRLSNTVKKVLAISTQLGSKFNWSAPTTINTSYSSKPISRSGSLRVGNTRKKPKAVVKNENDGHRTRAKMKFDDERTKYPTGLQSKIDIRFKFRYLSPSNWPQNQANPAEKQDMLYWMFLKEMVKVFHGKGC